MKLAFKKPTSVFDHTICIWTNSPYCHVELVFDEYGQTSAPEGSSSFGYLCFSSDTKSGGTRFKRIHFPSPDYTLVPLESSPGQADIADKYATSKLGLKYDYVGLFGFVLPFGEHDDHDRFCSEIVTEIMQHALGWPAGVKPWQVSPGKLYDLTLEQ